MSNVLVLCTGNSCRSQMAEGYLRNFLPKNVNVYSAGIETHGVNPKAIAIMKEDGIDITSHSSNHIDEYKLIEFEYVITVCDNAKESCPYFPSKAQLLHRDFPDPAKATGSKMKVMNAFRTTRDLVKNYCREFAENNFEKSERVPFAIISVFHNPSKNLKGNTAAVVNLSWALSDEKMQSIAADFNQPATSFIWPTGIDNEFNIRWFAPDSEIGLCGHGSLAAIAYLCQNKKEIKLKYRSGFIKGSRLSEKICGMLIDAIPCERLDSIPEVASKGLGVNILEFHQTGNKEIVLVKTEKEVREMKPDFAKLRESNIFGYIVTAPGDNVDFVSRTIVPHVQQLEDPATGSSHAALVPFWGERLNKTEMKGHQLSARGGEFICTWQKEMVQLKGLANVWSTGNLDI